MAAYRVDGSVGLICLNNPPSNLLNVHVRREIVKYISIAEKDCTVSVIALYGNEHCFSLGNQEIELNFGDTNSPNGFEVADSIESCTKPVIAAIHGKALGGSLEMALACHYRIALSKAKLGLPQVKLGLIPHSGGTQRLPRLIGMDAAIKWICYGDEHSADEAAQLGLIDRIFPASSDIVQCILQYAPAIAGKSLMYRRASKCLVDDSAKAGTIFSKHKAILSRKSRGNLAPLFCLETTRHAATLSYLEAVGKETDAMRLLATSDQSKALRYVHSVEQISSQWSESNSARSDLSLKPTEVRSAAVIGLGTMGRGIVISLLRAGITDIRVVEMHEKSLRAGLSFIRNSIENYLRKGVIDETQHSSMVDAVTVARDYGDLKDVDIVIEAVFESMQVKKEIFSKLNNICKPSAVLASNTSALDIDEIASATTRPQQVIGMHFFAPAHVMRLLENVKGSMTSPEVIATAMNMGKRMGKVTVLVGNCYGFVGNRMFGFYKAESDFLLEEGAYPEQVDQVLRNFGFAMGRYQVGDLSGNDVGYKMRSKFGITNKQQEPGSPERDRHGRRYCPLSDLLVESGRLGYKSGGKGWFRYVGERKTLTVDPEVTKMIDDYRKRNSITPRSIDSEEILERMLYPLINEGFKILEEGIASDPYVADLVYIHGYAWPRHTGGPMFYANTIGLPRVLSAINKHWQRYGASAPHWEPSKMLVKLVKEHGNPDISKWMELGTGYRSSL